MDNHINNIQFLRILLKWKWHLLIISITAIIIGLLVSEFILKPKFKSTAYVYPSNVAPYSSESETEQIIQWLNSKAVKDSVIKKFDLAQHYGINTQNKYFQSTMDYLIGKNIKISKTQYESVEITVIDRDPVMARDIVNGIIDYTNIVIRSAQANKYKEVVVAIEQVLSTKANEIDSLKLSFKNISTQYGIYEIEGQSREIARSLLRNGSNTGSTNKLNTGMMERGGDLIYLNARLKDISKEYSDIAKLHDIAILDATKKFTFFNIVASPQVADKKYFPKPIFIASYFLLASLFLSIITISIIEYRKKLAQVINQ